MSKISKRAILMPLIVGVILGIISVVIGKIPAGVAVWSGLRVLGKHDGYLLGALIVAYANAKSWKRSFITSALTPVIATVIYYLLIALFRIFGVGQTESFGAMVKDFAVWCVIGIAVGAASAAVMWFMTYGKKPLLRYGALALPYIGFWIIAIINLIRIFGWYHNPGYLTSSWMGYNFYEDIYEVGFTVVLTTVLFIISIFRLRKEAVK